MHQLHIYINIRFTFLENVVLLSLPVILVSFEFMNVSIIGTFLFLLGNWCSENTIVRKLGKKVCGKPVFFKELQAARNVSKDSLQFNKIPNKTSFADIFRNMHFLRATKKVLQKQLAKIDLKAPWKSCDEIDSDVMKFIL